MVGNALTVTVAVLVHPLLSLYVIILVPVATPVTLPVVLVPLTVATDVEPEVHGLVAAAVPDPVRVVLPVPQTASVPEMVGNALTVTVAVLVHPLLSL
jgi:hypothetical protein